MRASRRDHYLAPATNDNTATVIDEAIRSLATLTTLDSAADPGVTLHLLVSLATEIGQRIPRAVADARAQEYSWAEIADLLGTTRASAWQRYAPVKPTPEPGH
jgi:hypothetical protein